MNRRNRSANAERGTTRRTILAGATTAAIGLAAGCLSEDEESVPDPISIDSEQGCDNCTMTIGNQPGPAGQVHYEDPADVLDDDADRPAQFCSSLCAYAFSFEHEDTADPEVTYLTDYSAVDYEVDESSDSDNYVLSRHLDADAFAAATGLDLIVDSEVEGAMGGSIVAFSDSDDADAFNEEYGGEHYEHEDVTGELVMSLM
ncbi:NosL family protein [Natrialba magadii ATCC 43099]|uniref:Lipoprotein NosL n=1 Tax=Natrialba magadii (strain ATCC 43099 / DSM 3394 / CCM 3739 / CIP 104546 / IAM 13178 / JCM 8861 / NBRC 102185 / NCIMB 2190 / MS3) TaxID=547559 RepID=D3SZ46_NATMM|nr:nitrous oxide reductase accessory protein NosL [Natrialba magadii]ADD06238.1 NosL family protein [Natrialba magadii ATCC 43099]ELY31047.1 lipoprotein NosL [Natrialba magadii ATCC 43099]